MKLKFYAIPAAIVAVCLVFAVIVRFSYTDGGAKVYDYAYTSDGVLSDMLKGNKITAPDDIISQAELIAEAKYTGNRKITGSAFYSQVNVTRVFKGDKTLVGKEICVIEPVSTFTKTKFVNGAGRFLIPLQKGENYLLLLKHKKFDPRRTLDDFQQSQYYPVTQGAFGCYRLFAKNQTELMDSNKTYTINSLKGFDIFTGDRKTLNTYYKYKSRIFQCLGIG